MFHLTERIWAMSSKYANAEVLESTLLMVRLSTPDGDFWLPKAKYESSLAETPKPPEPKSLNLCKVKECGADICSAQSRKMCLKHYREWLSTRGKNSSTCSVLDCTEPVHALRFCTRHYWQVKRGKALI